MKKTGPVALILAGGKSSRMGTDKATLEYRGKQFLEISLRLATTICPEIHILGRDLISGKNGKMEIPPGVFPGDTHTHPDKCPFCGPLFSIADFITSHNLYSGTFVLLSVDMPAMETVTLKELIHQAEESHANWVFFETTERTHYFPSLIEGRIFQSIAPEDLKNKGFHYFRKLMEKSHSIGAIPVEPEKQMQFTNINSPEDLAFLSTGGISPSYKQ